MSSLRVATTDLARMREALFVEGEHRARKRSRYWILLTLSAVIAAAGVVADSTATVIGAMIVAPLMTPILGTVFAMVVGDRTNLLRSVGLVSGGALVVIALSYGFGLLVPLDVVAATNSQVASRVSPGLIDLVAALATGAVGAFALVRDDVGDTLPGVAIAISLVPPLAVVGLTLEAGATDQAAGALLLFVTNVTAILASGALVMGLYRVSAAAQSFARGRRHRAAAVTTVGLLVLVATPLAVSSVQVTRTTTAQSRVATVATRWADDAGWEVTSVGPEADRIVVRVLGPLPMPDPQVLRRSLDAAGLTDVGARVEMIPERKVDLPAG